MHSQALPNKNHATKVILSSKKKKKHGILFRSTGPGTQGPFRSFCLGTSRAWQPLDSGPPFSLGLNAADPPSAAPPPFGDTGVSRTTHAPSPRAPPLARRPRPPSGPARRRCSRRTAAPAAPAGERPSRRPGLAGSGLSRCAAQAASLVA